MGESSEFSKFKLESWYRALATGPWKLKPFLTFIATHFEAKPNTVVMFLAALQIQP